MNFDPKKIDRAGRIIAGTEGDGSDAEYNDAVRLISAWRADHSHPLNTFRANLQRRAGDDGIVAQRLKRLPSIVGKLKRLRRLRLSQIQDIGGCRVVVPEAGDAYDVAAGLADSNIRHRPLHRANYIQEPRRSGYRSLHLVYQYNTDRAVRYDGLKIEIQLRSRLQHQWATAVETVGTFIGDELKSGRGDKTWLRFFALMSSAIAMREGYPIVPKTPVDRNEIVSEIRKRDLEAGISDRLNAIEVVSERLQEHSAGEEDNLLIELNMEDHAIRIWPFGPDDLEAANDLYSQRERDSLGNPKIDVVLVYASSLSSLRRAYPNYFMDIGEFRRLFTDVAGLSQSPRSLGIVSGSRSR